MLSMLPDLILIYLIYICYPWLFCPSYGLQSGNNLPTTIFYWLFCCCCSCLHSKLCTLWYKARMIVWFVDFNLVVFQLITPLSLSFIHIKIYFFPFCPSYSHESITFVVVTCRMSGKSIIHHILETIALKTQFTTTD